MRFTFECEKCGVELEGDSSLSGTSVDCPECNQPVTVPKAWIGPGVIIGGFKVKKLLGCGAMGAVYLAHQTSMDRDVALKILPPNFYKDKDRLAMFQEEVRLQAKLEHPNIVTAHDSGVDDGIYYLAMVYLPESLSAKLEREGVLSEQEALSIVHRIAGALAYAWERHRLLHRDIKPDNIMLDEDGNPRLTDLGLSKSMALADEQTEDEWLAGTPNYMSPEQAAGVRDIDFRSDIYSLGATLYHLLTGVVPFEGTDSEEIFKKQTTEPLTDPRDLNKNVSDECVELLALMLALDRNDRHASWNTLIGDMQRVMAGEHPSKKPLDEHESVMLKVCELEHRHLVLRKSVARRLRERARVQGRKSHKLRNAFAVLFFLAVLGVGAWIVLWGVPWEEQDVATLSETGEEVEGAQIDAEIAEARTIEFQRILDEARAYEELQPSDYTGAIHRYEEIARQGEDTEFAAIAAEELQRLIGARQQAMDEVIAELSASAEASVADGMADEAIARLLAYDGPLAAETDEQRVDLAGRITRRMEEAERIRQQQLEAAQVRLADLVSSVAEDLIEMNFDQAANRVRIDQTEEDWALVKAELGTLVELVEAVSSVPQFMLRSLRADRGREVTIRLQSGPQLLTIRSVGRDGRIRAQRRFEGVAGFLEQTFRVEDLAIQEWFDRLGPDPAPDRDIMRGLLLNQVQNTEVAMRFFQRADNLLADELIKHLGQEVIGVREQAATAAFASVLRAANLPPGTPATEDVIRQIRRTAYPAAHVVRIRNAAERFRKEYGDTEHAVQVNRLLGALERVDTVPREVAEEVLERAVRRLRADNPAVEELSVSYATTDDGVEMDLSGNPGLVTLTGLERLPLRKLDLSKTGVRDLRPLRMMPLRELNLAGSAVEDIQILRGMPLEVLNLSDCNVHNIRPLEGAPLRELDLTRTPVNMITVLSGMPLNTLLLYRTRVTDFRPLEGMPLKVLLVARTRISDLSFLRGTELEYLYAWGTAIHDLSPLEGLPLRNIAIGETRVTDLSPLKSMPLLESLSIASTRVTDLSPLRGLPLRRLDIDRTSISDLSPLTGMSLTRIRAEEARQLMDLTPLAGMTTLEHFYITWPDIIRIMNPTLRALQDGQYDSAAQQALTMAVALEGVPAFENTVRLLRDMGEEHIPAIQAAAPDTIRDTAKAFGRFRYALGPGCADYNTALAFSRSVGGTLASVTTYGERDWLVEKFGLYGIPLRLGGSDARQEGNWQWSSGEPWHYQAWLPGQPDGGTRQNSLVMLWHGLWDDTECDHALPYLIQWEELEPGYVEQLPDEAFSASSVLRSEHFAPHLASLARFSSTDSASNWEPAVHDIHQWIQVDLGQVRPIGGVGTLGRGPQGQTWNQYVTRYELQGSLCGNAWETILSPEGEKEFVGNADRNTPKIHLFPREMRYRYIRFLPRDWHSSIHMRIEVYPPTK